MSHRGVQGIVVASPLGEGSELTLEERSTLVNLTVQHFPGTCLLHVPHPALARDLAALVTQSGADGLLFPSHLNPAENGSWLEGLGCRFFFSGASPSPTALGDDHDLETCRPPLTSGRANVWPQWMQARLEADPQEGTPHPKPDGEATTVELNPEALKLSLS